MAFEQLTSFVRSVAETVRTKLTTPLQLLHSQRDAPNPPFFVLLLFIFLFGFGASGVSGYAWLLPPFRHWATANRDLYYETFYFSQLLIQLIPAFYAKSYASAVGTSKAPAFKSMIISVIGAPLLLWNFATAARHVGILIGWSENAVAVTYMFNQIWSVLTPKPTFPLILLYSLLTIVVAPLIEELFFRGFFFNHAYRRCPLSVAIVLTSAVFALLHISPHRSGESLFVLFVNGVIFSLLRVSSGSIYPPMICHILINILVMLPKWTSAFLYFTR
jgi:membrane protease YdiL (CAAX protease family)